MRLKSPRLRISDPPPKKYFPISHTGYYGTLIGNPTPGIQWYNFRPPGVTPNRGMGPREALFVKLL